MPARDYDLTVDLDVSRRLREARLRRDDNLTRFSVAVGISDPTLRKLEAGKPVARVTVDRVRLWLDGDQAPVNTESPLKAQLDRIESALQQVLSKQSTT